MKKEVNLLICLFIFILIFSIFKSENVNATPAGCQNNNDCEDGFSCTTSNCKKDPGATEGICEYIDDCLGFGKVCTTHRNNGFNGCEFSGGRQVDSPDIAAFTNNLVNEKCNDNHDCYFEANSCQFGLCIDTQNYCQGSGATKVCPYAFLPSGKYCFYPPLSIGSLPTNLCNDNELCTSRFGVTSNSDPLNNYPQCKAVCTNECSKLGSTGSCTAANSKEVCGQFDQDSCLDLGSSICPSAQPVCQNGNCIKACESDCDPSKGDQCYGNSYKECKDTGKTTATGTKCYQLTNPSLCGSDEVCQNGQCIKKTTTTCKNECDPVKDSRICSGEKTYKTCVLGNEGCYVWSEDSCTGNFICDLGVCKDIVSQPIQPSGPELPACFGFNTNCGSGNCENCFTSLGLKFPFGTCAYEFKGTTNPNYKCPNDYGYLIEPSCHIGVSEDDQKCMPVCSYVGFRKEQCGDFIDDNCDGILGPPLCTNQLGVCSGARADCNRVICTDDDFKNNNVNYDGPTETRCDDKLDNDCDGLTDSQDPDCKCLLQSASISCEKTEEKKCTGTPTDATSFCGKITTFAGCDKASGVCEWDPAGKGTCHVFSKSDCGNLDITNCKLVPGCSVESVSNSLNCKPGDPVTMNGNAKGTSAICNKINNFQIDANNEICNVQYLNGIIQGINSNLIMPSTDNPGFSTTWNVPGSKPSDLGRCCGETISATSAGLYSGGPPGTGNLVSTSKANGVITFSGGEGDICNTKDDCCSGLPCTSGKCQCKEGEYFDPIKRECLPKCIIRDACLQGEVGVFSTYQTEDSQVKVNPSPTLKKVCCKGEISNQCDQSYAVVLKSYLQENSNVTKP